MAWSWPLERNQILSEELVEAGLDAIKLELQESQHFHCLITIDYDDYCLACDLGKKKTCPYKSDSLVFSRLYM